MCTCPNARPSTARAKSACVIRPATSSPFLKCLPLRKTVRSLADGAHLRPHAQGKAGFFASTSAKFRRRGWPCRAERARAAHERLRSRQGTEGQGNRGRNGRLRGARKLVTRASRPRGETSCYGLASER